MTEKDPFDYVQKSSSLQARKNQSSWMDLAVITVVTGGLVAIVWIIAGALT